MHGGYVPNGNGEDAATDQGAKAKELLAAIARQTRPERVDVGQLERETISEDDKPRLSAEELQRRKDEALARLGEPSATNGAGEDLV